MTVALPEVELTDTGIEMLPDPTRVVTRYFVPGREDVGPTGSRAPAVIGRILALTEEQVEAAMRDVDDRFGARHPDLHRTFEHHARRIADGSGVDLGTSPARRLLLGASFTHEYAIEGAALCNPSGVLFGPEADDGGRPFALSLRGIGEGHRSSVSFRSGAVHADGTIEIDTPGSHPSLEQATTTIGPSSYRVRFDESTLLSQRVLWPQDETERQGMEDVRLVRFEHDDDITYYGTYTAFDGVNIGQRLLQTEDFTTFEMSPMTGAVASGKGLALFPRLVGGRFVALTRSDRETNAIAFSDDLREWRTSHPIQIPTEPWEMLQLGNCGSPIETEAGWVVITHGVGPMRTYALGALLLDLEHPERVVGRSRLPIITPADARRDGYVPNVVYSCGAFAHGDTLVLPYGLADQSIRIATLSLSQLVAALVAQP